MIYTSDISPVLKEWKERLNRSDNSFDYKVAISECINDLENQISNTINKSYEK